MSIERAQDWVGGGHAPFQMKYGRRLKTIANHPSTTHLVVDVASKSIVCISLISEALLTTGMNEGRITALSRVYIRGRVEATYEVANRPVRSDSDRIIEDHDVAVEKEQHARAGELALPYEPDFAVDGDAVLVEYQCYGVGSWMSVVFAPEEAEGRATDSLLRSWHNHR